MRREGKTNPGIFKVSSILSQYAEAVAWNCWGVGPPPTRFEQDFSWAEPPGEV